MGPVQLNNSLHTQFARAQAFLPQKLLGFLMILKFLFEEYLCWFCRPVEVHLRWKFGTRGHGLFQTCQICVTGSLVGFALTSIDPLMTLFCLASAAMSAYHRFEAVRWEMRGLVRYSWSSGDPLPIWGWAVRAVQRFGINPSRFVTVSLICRFYEPALILAIGLSIRPVSMVLSAYLIACSVALFIKGLIVHNRLLDMKRDQIDARLMSQWIASIHQATASGQAAEQYFVVKLAEPPLSKPDDVGKVANSPEQQPVADTAVVPDNLVSFSCRKCNAQYHVHQKHRGRKGTCKKCGAAVVVAAA